MKSLPTNETRTWAIINTIQQIIRGRTNATGTVTLETGTTTTTVQDDNVAPGDTILLSPQNADAADELLTVWVSATAKGEFTLTHSNDVTTRTFRYLVAGG
jgi:hypothetical protein